MSLLAPTLESFFTDRLIGQLRVSPNTVAQYRDTFRLLLAFAQQQTGTRASSLRFEDLDAAFIGGFLHHLEEKRGNGVRTRNTRLAAIHSLFRYAAPRHPEHAALFERVLAIPSKRFERTLVSFLSDEETQELLDAPDKTTFIGRRDYALLLVAVQTGLRVSELVGLTRRDVVFGTGPHVRCTGKGRKERITPLTKTTASVLKEWLRECGGSDEAPLFASTHGGGPLCRRAVNVLVVTHVATATKTCPSLCSKQVTPHVLRHTAAMRLLHAGVDSSVIALWLGHESVETTQIYIHADLAMKEVAINRTTPLGEAPGRYRPPDALLAFLEGL